MNNQHPRVSVIIPSYSAGATICHAVDSVLSQTFGDYEVIVVDDGSTDDTRVRLQAYGDRIRYIYQENQERSAARNNGIRGARGEYVAFLDADDSWAPHKLERQIALLDRHLDLGMVFAWASAFDPSTGRILRTLGTQFPLDGAAGMDAFERILQSSPPMLTVVARTQCVREAGLFDLESVSVEDWDLWLRISLRHRVGFVPEMLARYRLSGAFVPARLAVCRVQHSLPYVTRKVFALARTLSCRNDVLGLENAAMRQAYWKAGLIEYAIGNIDSAWSNLNRAHESDPAFFHGRRDALIYSLTDFALNLYDTWTPPAAAHAFLKRFFDNLPPGLAQLRAVKRAVRRMVAAGHGFRAWAQNEPALARRSFLRALARYPELWRNRGIWSICMRSLLGQLANPQFLTSHRGLE